jgi:VanZ family protein
MDHPNRSKFPRFWFPVILYSGIIFYASSVPNVKAPLAEISFDAVLHVLLYAPFGYLLARAFYNARVSVSQETLLRVVLLISLLYGGSDEIHQSFVPGRDASLTDVIADMIGGAMGGYLYLLSLKRWQKK